MAKAKDEETAEEATKKGGKAKLIMIILPVVLLLAGGAYFFLLKPSDAAATTELPPPEAGAVVQLDPITINLAGGHFLKLGLALQPTVAAVGHGEVSGAKALDLAIDEFSGKTVDDLSSTDGREEAKAELIARIKLAYLPHDAEAKEEAEETKSASSEGESEGGSEGKSEGKSEGEHKESAGSEEGDSGSSSTGHEEEKLTGAEAIKKAAKLTVQPDIYDVYFTEFVMQ